MTMTTRRSLLFACALLFLSMGFASAEDDTDDDHDAARRAVEQGNARPLAELLTKIQPQLGGKVIGVELEHEHERYIYEFKVVTPSGELREIYVDAVSGAILKNEEE